MKKSLKVLSAGIVAGCAIVARPATANELRISTTGVQRGADAKTLRVDARATWKNGWRNSRNHDALWFVVKLRGNPRTAWTHGRLVRAVTQGAPQGSCSVSKDQVGAFCQATGVHRGDVSWQLSLDVELVGLREADIAAGTAEALVFGVEMVYIPAGPFTIGDPDPKSVDGNAFYRADAQGGYAGTLPVKSEEAIPVGRQEGALFYKSGQYAGDGQGPVPAAFPK